MTRKATQVTIGGTKDKFILFCWSCFFEKWPTLAQKRTNILLTYGIVTHPDAIKILRDALPEPRDVAFKTQKRHEHHERLTPCWNPENRNEPPQIYVSKNVGEFFRQPQPDDSLRYLEPLKFGHGPNGLGPQAISVGNFVERLLRGSRAIDAEAKTHRGEIHPSEKVTS